jgi:uncharacterized membrane protein HdeD (DUF308 family)
LTAGTEIRRSATTAGDLLANIMSTMYRSNTMNKVLARQPWKETLAVGVLTAILGGIVLAGPGPSILVTVRLFDVCLLGFA